MCVNEQHLILSCWWNIYSSFKTRHRNSSCEADTVKFRAVSMTTVLHTTWKITHEHSYYPNEITTNIPFLSSNSGRECWNKSSDCVWRKGGVWILTLVAWGSVLKKTEAMLVADETARRDGRGSICCYWEGLPVGLVHLLEIGWFLASVRKVLANTIRTVNTTSSICSFWLRSMVHVCVTWRHKGQESTWA